MVRGRSRFSNYIRYTHCKKKKNEAMVEGSCNHILPPARVANLLSQYYTFEELLLTCYNSLSPRSYVHPRSHRSPRSTAYSQPPQKTAQLWNKSKDELATQLADLKSYVANKGPDQRRTGY